MPSLAYGIGAYKRTTGDLPPLECINLFVESARTSEGSVCLQSRPGLGQLASIGTGPINGIFSQRGVLSGDDFSISSSTLFRGTTSIGTVAGSGATSFAGSDTELLIARGSTLSRYNGTTLNSPTFPDSASVTAVCFIGSLFVAARASSAKFYWSAPLNGNSWDALAFATAEREADTLLDIKALGDNLWLFGQSTIEVWQNTGDAALPFTRIEQIAFDKGIIATGASAHADNSLFFIGSDAVVYRVQDVPARISDHWLEEKIAGSSSQSMFSFKLHGHEFVCVRLSGTAGQTFAYDCATQEWCEFQTNGGQWIARCAAMKGTTVYLGHQTTGQVMGFDEFDDLGVAMERRFTCAAQMDQPVQVDNIRLWVNAGEAPTGVTPTVSLRYSRDAGRSFSSYIDTDLGNAADGGTIDYRVLPEWRRLGMFDFPGLLADIKCSAGTDFRVSAVKFNEPKGGRSRA